VAVTGNNVNVYVNQGTRLSSSPVVIPVGGAATRIAVGELTGDGRPDLVVLDWAGAAVRTFANTGAVGAVGFTMRSNRTVASRPLFADIADLNGDGRGDVLFTQESYLPDTSHALGIMLGAGDGTVLAPSYRTFTARPDRVRTADLDGDGRTDVVVAFSVYISAFRNLGAGPYPAPVSLGAPVSTAQLGNMPDFRLADLDEDGHLDLAAAVYSAHSLAVLRGDGAGGFGAAQTYPAGQSVYGTANGVALGDWNGDGHLDAAVNDNANPYLYAYMGTGDGTFPARTDIGVGAGPQRVLAGDLDGDEDLDLVTINYTYGNATVASQTSPGSFSASTISLGSSSYPWSGELADVNGDGHLDLIVAHIFANQVSVRLGTGTGTFGAATTYAVSAGPQAVAVGDLDGDLDLDLAVVSSTGRRVDLLLGRGDGTFTVGTPIALSGAGYGVAVGDVDGDGIADLVVAAATVAVYRGTGGGAFAAPVSLANTGSPVLLADLTGDGRPEILTLHTTSPYPGVGVSINNGSGSFGAVTVYATGSGSYPYGLAVADLDGDGDLDVAVTDPGTSSKGFLVQTWKNLGGGTLGGARLWQTGQDPRGVIGADLDGDGQVDLASANASSSTLSILRGVCR
jgi:hypothetical protein